MVESALDRGSAPRALTESEYACKLDVCRKSGRQTVWCSPAFLMGAGLIGLMLVVAFLAPWLSPENPNAVDVGQRLLAPSWGHPFGTDQFGRDMMSRIFYGARLAFLMAGGATALSLAVGGILGILVGYYGRWIDRVLSTIVEIWMALPGLLLALVLVAAFGPSIRNATLALGLTGIPYLFRTTRGCVLSTREEVFVDAASAVGVGNTRIMLRYVLPQLFSTLIVIVTLRMSTVLLSGGALSFIGLGAQPPTPEWGAMLSSGREYMMSAWWLATFPGAAFALTVMGLNLLGDGLRDVTDPMT